MKTQLKLFVAVAVMVLLGLTSCNKVQNNTNEYTFTAEIEVQRVPIRLYSRIQSIISDASKAAGIPSEGPLILTGDSEEIVKAQLEVIAQRFIDEILNVDSSIWISISFYGGPIGRKDDTLWVTCENGE